VRGRVRLEAVSSLLFNMVRSGKSPYLSLQEVYELGFDYALCPGEPMLAMHKAVKEMMETSMRAGCTTNAIADRLTPFEDCDDFIGLPDMAARAKRYGA
jgi:2-methylisocitrate lyase-like PEP mutase family enzyme